MSCLTFRDILLSENAPCQTLSISQRWKGGWTMAEESSVGRVEKEKERIEGSND